MLARDPESRICSLEFLEFLCCGFLMRRVSTGRRELHKLGQWLSLRRTASGKLRDLLRNS
jgi:hypothetical protein